MEPMVFELGDGHPVAGPGWVYAWIHERRVFYIGATWLHPAARAERHLHGETDDPRSLGIRELVERWETSPVIVAVPVPPELDRQVMKRALIAGCAAREWLAEAFIGGAEEARVEAAGERWLAGAVSALGVQLN